MRRLETWGLTGLLLVLAGCQTTTVRRTNEVARFRAEARQDLGALKLDPQAPLTVEQCVALALENNLDYRVRELQAGLQDEQVRLALVDGLPKGSVGWSRSYRSNRALIEAGGRETETTDRDLSSFSLQTMIPILDWGATWYGYQIAKDRRRQAHLLLLRARQTLARDVRAAYARYAGLLRQERLGRIAVYAAQELLRQARSLEREGLAAPSATLEVEAGLAQATLQWSVLRRAVEQARLALAQRLSLPPGAEFTIRETLPPLLPLPPPAAVPALEEQALTARPELSVQDRERQVAAHAVRQQFAQFLPRVDGQIGYNWNSLSTAVNPGFFLFGVQVTDSLLNGGSQWWRYQLAQRTQTVEEARTLLLSLGILYEVNAGVLRLYAVHDTMVAREALVRAQQAALKEIISRFRQGLESGGDTVRSLADLYLARLQLDQAQTEYQEASYELDAATAGPAAPPPSGPPAAPPSGLPVLVPAAPLDALGNAAAALPPIDLREYPELQELVRGPAPP